MRGGEKDREWIRAVRQDGTIKIPKRILPYYAGKRVYVVSEADSVLVCKATPPESFLKSKSVLKYGRLGEYTRCTVTRSGFLFVASTYLARIGVERQVAIACLTDATDGVEILNPRYLKEYRKKNKGFIS